MNLIAKEFSEELLTLEGGTIEALMVKQKLFADKPIADIFGAAFAACRVLILPTPLRLRLARSQRGGSPGAPCYAAPVRTMLPPQTFPTGTPSTT